ncbi:cytochrome oxidase putative small subunit CydP [Herbaspirillum sp.]|uniref:cytochrome oxidase putative small subunit CydP n=1 Tax=Herbaspirillum sp. TaxID=1890675 RepID=UPI0025BE7307|nr:cytochrome oxidase putative small subunit CydP [Herbaspirillum sp.]
MRRSTASAPSASKRQRLHLPRIPRLTRLPLGVEITLLLVVKIALIVLLAKTFFAHPEAKHMRMPTASVEARMLAPAQIPASLPAISTPSEVTHGSDR